MMPACITGTIIVTDGQPDLVTDTDSIIALIAVGTWAFLMGADTITMDIMTPGAGTHPGHGTPHGIIPTAGMVTDLIGIRLMVGVDPASMARTILSCTIIVT